MNTAPSPSAPTAPNAGSAPSAAATSAENPSTEASSGTAQHEHERSPHERPPAGAVLGDALGPAAASASPARAEREPEGDLGITGDPGPSDASPSGAASRGELDARDIRRVISANQPHFRRCYAAELKNDPTFSTKLSVQLAIERTGRVIGVTLSPTSGKLGFESCLKQVVQRMRFPAPKGGVVAVKYPLVFRPPS